MISLHEERYGLDRAVQPQASLASWYTQGHTDGFGDRLLMSDNTGAASFELLRFRPALTIVSGFERALRARVERQQFFRHPLFPAVRAVDHLDGGRVLALVSTYTPGRRLSEVLHDPRRSGLHPALAAWLIRQLVPALAELHRRGGGPHGVLTADRIVITPEGSPVVVDHALGSALEQLYLPPARLWSDFGLIAPSTTAPGRFDGRGDIVQLGLIVLSLCLGRRITPDDYPSKLDLLLDEFTDIVGRRTPKLAGPLRLWLERALRANGNLFTTAEQAEDGIAELSGLIEPGTVEHLLADQATHSAQATESPISEAAPQTIALDASAAALQDFPAEAAVTSASVPAAVDQQTVPARPANRLLLVTCAVLAGVVVAQAGIIVRLLSRASGATTSAAVPAAAEVPVMIDSPRAGDIVMVDGRQVGVTPLGVTVGAAVHSIRVMSQPAPTPPVPSVPSGRAASPPVAKAVQPPPDPLKALAARQKSGGLRLVSPIELSVFEGDRLLGSSADGPVVTSAGEHQLDLVNNVLRYRTRQTVTIKTGEVVSLRVSPPDGRLNINASPWAQVWVDGRAMGDTPLANVAVPIGEHDVMFRHPQLGERHVTVLVRSGDANRVSAAFGP
jgi:hypothetical protein